MFAVLLCAGEGTRMNDTRTHKVCYEIAGIPAVIRQINALKEAGIENYMVVVGAKADKVMDTLSGVSGVVYAYQPKRLGTGNAALYGLKALKSIGYSGGVLVTMGDKIVDSSVYKDLIERSDNGKKTVFAVQPKAFNKSGGRIIAESGKALAIIEQTDSYALLANDNPALDAEAKTELLSSMGLSRKKAEAAVKRADNANGKNYTEISGKKYYHRDIEDGEYVNAALYVFDIDEALSILETAGTDNAQGEVYLTDVVNRAAERDGGVDICPITDRSRIYTYSTMEELLSLQNRFASENRYGILRTASEILREIQDFGEGTKQYFHSIYGDDEGFISERRKAYTELVTKAIDRYGDRKMLIIRSPGRVNLMGRHIEHRGGSINVVAVNRETLLAVFPGEKGIVNISNTDSRFPDSSFSILDIILKCNTSNWLEFIESKGITELVASKRGEWVNYVEAAVLRIQLERRDMLLCGMDMMFSGNIPLAAGLSSSSSIVVASAKAVIELNGLDYSLFDSVILCGEGEWFVGSRGGAGDHAAMLCCKKGELTHLRFAPFGVGDSVPFPDSCRLVVANSFEQAKKSAGARDRFNQQVASYEFGLRLIKKAFPQYAQNLQVFRDLYSPQFSSQPSLIYEMLLSLPQTATSEELYAALPEQADEIRHIQKSHAIPDKYEIRSVVLYGIAECARAEKCVDMLKRSDYISLGQMMNISHDGDRVFKNGKPFVSDSSDSTLYRLIADLKSENLARITAAQIYNQPGAYACSTERIDFLVDTSLSVKGVYGAQICGAGLGGCILILADKDCTATLLDTLKTKYYDAYNLEMGAEVYFPISGTSVLR